MDVNLPLLVAVIGGLVFIAIFSVAYAMFGRSRTLEERVQSGEKEKQPGLGMRDFLKRSEHIFRPLGEIIPRSPEEMSRQERRLVQAGFRRKDAPVLSYGVKLALAILLLVAARACSLKVMGARFGLVKTARKKHSRRSAIRCTNSKR